MCAQVLLETYGLHGALLIAGAIGLHSVPCGLLMPLSRFERDRRKHRQDRETSSLCACPNVASYLYVITYLRFLVYLISLFNVSVAASSYYLYVPKYLILNGYSHLKASFIISFTGVGSIISRLLSGVASLDPGVDNILIYGGIIFIAALVAFLIPVTVNSTVAQFVLAVLYGLYTGGSYALLGPLVLEILGVRHVSTGTGLCMFAAGIGSLVGPPISGKCVCVCLRERMFVLVCACMSMCVCVFALAKPVEFSGIGQGGGGGGVAVIGWLLFLYASIL